MVQYADVVRSGEVVVTAVAVHAGQIIVVVTEAYRVAELVTCQVLPPEPVVPRTVRIAEALPVKADQ